MRLSRVSDTPICVELGLFRVLIVMFPASSWMASVVMEVVRRFGSGYYH
jgi:hypothetical protein